MFKFVNAKELQGLREQVAQIHEDKFRAIMLGNDVDTLRSRAESAEKELDALRVRKTLHCSFCGKSQHEVRKLIAGPTVFICDECVNLCADILKEEDRAKADLKLIDDAISAYFGDRCPDNDPECATCRAWDHVDKLAGRKAETTTRAEDEAAFLEGIEACRNRLSSIITDIKSRSEVSP